MTGEWTTLSTWILWAWGISSLLALMLCVPQWIESRRDVSALRREGIGNGRYRYACVAARRSIARLLIPLLHLVTITVLLYWDSPRPMLPKMVAVLSLLSVSFIVAGDAWFEWRHRINLRDRSGWKWPGRRKEDCPSSEGGCP